jgi:L-lysine exporter family protein LysE/ArgO
VISIFIQGLLISGGLIIAIGAQNAYILRQGLLGQKSFMLARYVLFVMRH